MGDQKKELGLEGVGLGLGLGCLEFENGVWGCNFGNAEWGLVVWFGKEREGGCIRGLNRGKDGKLQETKIIIGLKFD